MIWSHKSFRNVSFTFSQLLGGSGVMVDANSVYNSLLLNKEEHFATFSKIVIYWSSWEDCERVFFLEAYYIKIIFEPPEI